jgi:hypothetical protein
LLRKLYFDYRQSYISANAEVKVFSSITCPKGKYHCVSNITVEDNITAAGNITHNVARRYSNRFLRLFLFFLKKPPKIRNIPVTVFVARV